MGDGPGHALELVRKWGAVRHELFREVAINLGRLQREHANAKADASLATSREPSAWALEEAREADHHREVAEKHRQEILALNASLEQQVEARRAALASMKGAPSDEEEILRCEEALMLEATERSLELERLDTRERQVAEAEDAASAREVRTQEEVDRRVVEARADLANRYDLKLKLVEAEAKGRTAALRSRFAEAEQREKATAAALISMQGELASARAELLPLQRRVTNAESFAQQSREEALRRQTLQREHTPMLWDLRTRANQVLGAICDEHAPHPHAEDYANHLRFFTDVVTRLENRAGRARELVEEKSQGLLGHMFSRVFSHLQNINPYFDFDAAIAPVPEVIRDNLARWVHDNEDALVRAFASDDDAVVVVPDEGGVVDDGEDSPSDSASSMSWSDSEDAASNMSD
nr:paramyosin-like [Aegilops tauschii subsp. strangulata]